MPPDLSGATTPGGECAVFPDSDGGGAQRVPSLPAVPPGEAEADGKWLRYYGYLGREEDMEASSTIEKMYRICTSSFNCFHNMINN